MKCTGIVRSLDSFGRLTIPAELRRSMEITHDSQIEIYVEEEKVVLRVKKK